MKTRAHARDDSERGAGNCLSRHSTIASVARQRAACVLPLKPALSWLQVHADADCNLRICRRTNFAGASVPGCVTGNIEVYCRTVIDFYRFFFVNNSVLSTLSTEESVVMRGCNLCDNVRNKMWHHSVVILVCLCLCRQKLDSIKRVARIFLVHPRGSWRCLVRCSEIFTARRYA